MRHSADGFGSFRILEKEVWSSFHGNKIFPLAAKAAYFILFVLEAIRLQLDQYAWYSVIFI